MGRDDYIFKAEQGMIPGQGFRVCDVERSACYPAFAQSSDEGLLIDHGAASDVDEECISPHQA
jgi:hypothetical protein